MTRRLRIACDVDGVLVDFVEGLRDFVERATGTRPLGPCTEWDTLASWCYPVTWAEVGAHATEIVNELPWYPKASDTLDRLCRDHDVVFATSPMNADWLRARYRWLEAHGFDKKRQVHVCDKSWVHADVLIDDGVHNLTDLHGVTRPICIARPWNAHCPLSVERVDFEDVPDLLR